MADSRNNGHATSSKLINSENHLIHELIENSSELVFLLSLPEFSVIKASNAAQVFFEGIVSGKTPFTRLFPENEKTKILSIKESCQNGESASGMISLYTGKKSVPLNFSYQSDTYYCILRSPLPGEHLNSPHHTANESQKRKIINEYLTLFEDPEEVFYEVSMEGKIIFASPSSTTISGYSPEELIGKEILELYSNPDERALLLKELTQNGFIKDYSISLKKKNGESRKCLLTSRLIFDKDGNPEKIIGKLRVTGSEVFYEPLANRNKTHFQILLEYSGSLVFTTDPSGIILIINQSAAGFLGQDTEDIKGQNITRIFPKDHARILKKKIEIIKETGKGEGFHVVHKDKDLEFILMYHIHPVMKDNAIAGFVFIASDITERKHIEKELQKLNLAVENSAAAIMLTDQDGYISYINPRYSEMTGYSYHEIIGNKAKILENRDSQGKIEDTVLKSLREGVKWEGEIESETREGKKYWQRVSITPVKDDDDRIVNFIFISVDVTAAKRITEYERKARKTMEVLNETALRIIDIDNEKNVFKILGEQIGKIIPNHLFAISSFDSDTRVLTTEYIHARKTLLSAFFSLTKMSRREMKFALTEEEVQHLQLNDFTVLENGFTDLTKGVINEKINASLSRLFKVKRVFTMGIKRGKILLGNISFIELNAFPEIDTRIISNFVKQSGIALERVNLQNELIFAKEEAEEMSRIKSAFLANMSHELRTPLNGILGFSELLTEQIRNSSQRNMVSVIHKSGIRLLDTLNTILDFTTIEAKNVKLKYSEVNIHSLLNDIIHNYRTQAEQKGIELQVKTKNEFTARIVRNLVQKILSHLLNNAIKFTNQGSVLVSAELRNGTSNNLVIRVKDTGIGIPIEEQEHIFREFRQGSEGFTRKYEGTGLGLTICKKFSDIMGGELKVKSRPEKGSTFILSLPLERE